MQTTRREFMRQVGVTLAGLLVSSCDLNSRLTLPPAPSRAATPEAFPTCYVPPRLPDPTSTPQPAPRTYPTSQPPPPPDIPEGGSRFFQAVRTCWLDLRDSRLLPSGDTDFSNDLRRRHADALKTLVADKILQADVADAMSVAFEQAITHIQRQTVACCYEPLPPEYVPRQNLTTQAAILTEMVLRSGIDWVTADRAQAALARDMAWLAQFQAGKEPGQLEGIEVTPAEVEAAHILVHLLLGYMYV